MRIYFGHIVIHEVSHTMMGYSTQTRPLSERPDRRLLSNRKDAAETKGLNVH